MVLASLVNAQTGVMYQNKTYFLAKTVGANNTALWASNGTIAGTYKVHDFAYTEHGRLIVVNNLLYCINIENKALFLSKYDGATISLVGSRTIPQLPMFNTPLPAPKTIHYTVTPSVNPNAFYAKSDNIQLDSHNDNGQTHFTYVCQDILPHQIDFYVSESADPPCRPDTSIICNCAQFLSISSSTVIPNLVHDATRLILDNNKANANVVLYDSNGQVVRDFGRLSHNTLLDFSVLNNGLYIITINDGENSVKQKIIKL
jgi:ELWxxDGT repeat protein